MASLLTAFVLVCLFLPLPARADSSRSYNSSLTMTVQGSSHVFGDDYSENEHTLYNNNAVDESDFSCRFDYGGGSPSGFLIESYIRIERTNPWYDLDEYGECYAAAFNHPEDFNYYDVSTPFVYVRDSEHIPESVVSCGGTAASVNISIPELRSYFAATGVPHPEIMDIHITVSFDDGVGWNYLCYHEFWLRDCHMPRWMLDENGYYLTVSELSLTDAVPTGLYLPEGAPEVVSMTADWYTMFLTDGGWDKFDPPNRPTAVDPGEWDDDFPYGYKST